MKRITFVFFNTYKYKMFFTPYILTMWNKTFIQICFDIICFRFQLTINLKYDEGNIKKNI
jgi:hypothetical protein